MSEIETPVAPAPPRDRSPAARKAVRLKKAQREARIVGLLNRGVSVAEIASRERVTLNRMRKVVRAILEKRGPQAPAEYLALQVGRLNEALLLSYGAMYDDKSGANFRAIESVVRIVREMDRYHGFFPPAQAREPAAPPLPPSPERPLALEPPAAGGRLLRHREEPEGRRGDPGAAPQSFEGAVANEADGASSRAPGSPRPPGLRPIGANISLAP